VNPLSGDGSGGSAGAGSGRLPRGVERAVGDLADQHRLAEAFAGVTHVSVTLPMVSDPAVVTSYAENIAEAAASAGVQRLVLNTAAGVPETSTDVPAFEARRAAAATLLSSGVPTVVLVPLVYLENLGSPWVAGPTVHQGVLRYPLLEDLPVAWLSHDDLAAVTVAALSRSGIEGRTVRLGGPDVVTGADLARQIGLALGRDVEYSELDVDEFERGLSYAVGTEAAAGVASTYRWLGTADGARAGAGWGGDATMGRVEDLLGVRLTRLLDWAREQPWQRLAGAAA
jgi:uncharacterized protein YbjT (DUF2867 family)